MNSLHTHVTDVDFHPVIEAVRRGRFLHLGRSEGVSWDESFTSGGNHLKSMNIHHLELFYYVARHGGISEAVRHIPYGIQQPAVSIQVIQLEESLGVTLFHRRPFALTPPGRKLYRFIEPFFSGVEGMAAELRGGEAQQLRVGASGVFLRDHLPALVRELRPAFRNLRLNLREGHQPQLEAWLQARELDVAVTLLGGRALAGFNALRLLKLPLVLLVGKSSRIRSCEELWKRDRIEEPLVSLPAFEAIPRHFQAGLAGLGVNWFPSIEVSSIGLIETYVEHGHGVGLSVRIPRYVLPARLRALPLDGFPPVEMAALWPGKTTPMLKAFLEGLQRHDQALETGNAPGSPRQAEVPD